MKAPPVAQFGDEFFWNGGRDTVVRLCRLLEDNNKKIDIEVHISMESLVDYDSSVDRSGRGLIELSERIWESLILPLVEKKLRQENFSDGLLFILSQDLNG